MPRKPSKRREEKEDPALRNIGAGVRLVQSHPVFRFVLDHARIVYGSDARLQSGWARVTPDGSIYLNRSRLALPEEWAYAIGHAPLHLGMGHFRAVEGRRRREWNAACDVFVAKFLADLKFGKMPDDLQGQTDLPARDEDDLYRRFCDDGVPLGAAALNTADSGGDMAFTREKPAPKSYYSWRPTKETWEDLFARGLSLAISDAVRVAAGELPFLGATGAGNWSYAVEARSWLINSYPLLGALATAFHLIEDSVVCRRMDIAIAAVDPVSKEIYINPDAQLSREESVFVLAHELLHVGLAHTARRQGRDAFLWNVAADYVIDGWLVEMGVGQMPAGVLYDPSLKGESAESIYDRIVTDMRRFRKLASLRGMGIGDIIERRHPDWWGYGEGVELDEFYRGCLGQGLSYHEDAGRGFLPAGLVEEIRALMQPPIPWDVALAYWFDEHFPPLEKRRSYARLSRRQSASPDIPVPRWTVAPDSSEGRTFAVLLDTSGSMERQLLAKALGAIASYSISRDVRAVRVVFCDAATYDRGYMAPEEIADRVQVKGRGGTVLQPGVDLLENAEDFPEEGPVLIITDGYCDVLRVKRDHAYLLPHGHRLPFVPTGRVFEIR